MWFQFTVGKDKPPMLSVTIVARGVLSMDCSCKAFATLNVGVRVTITCHDLCNNRVDCRYRVFVPGLDLRGVLIDNANLSCSDLDSGDADTRTARFDRASLQNTSWIRTKAERASFRRASLISADFRGARLGNADFSEADLTQTKFAYADLRGASFSPKSAEGIRIHLADLRGVQGLTCEELKRMDDWTTACRDSDLECGAPSKGQCGPVAVPLNSGFRFWATKTP